MTNIIQTLSTIQGLSSILRRQVTVDVIQRNISQGGPQNPNLSIALGNPSFLDLKINDAQNNILNGSFDSYCIDYYRDLTQSGYDYNGDGDTVDQNLRLSGVTGYSFTENAPINFKASVYSSYDAAVLNNSLNGINNPQNLGIVNWLINNQNTFLNPSSTSSIPKCTIADIQCAIWKLINNVDSSTFASLDRNYLIAMFGGLSDTNVASIVTEAQKHANFVPQVGDKIAVILVPDGNTTAGFDGVPDGQIIIAAVDLTKLTASLGDRVWLDTNANGIQDTGEAGIGNVTVNLIDSSNNIISTTTTDANGAYNFAGLIPGSYSVQFVAPSGYMFSPQDQGGNDALDSDANITTSKTQPITLALGQNNFTLDAGLVPLASLGNFVFEDKNANGIQDAGEAGIAGATVNLIKNGNVIATTTTGTDGKYNFSNLTPGTGYQVQFVTPSGFTQSSPVDVGGNDSIDSDGTFTGVVTLAPGENNPTVDSGFYNLASVGDYVFADNNANGIQDTGDTPLNGVKVELIKNNAVVATVLSNPDGSYLFNGLVPGDYQVKFTAPTGYIFTTADAGNDTVDSDANPTTGLTQTVTLTSGQLNGTLDAGLVPLASLGNFVFEDKNANGIQDAGEAGIAGATVNLIKNGNVIATTTTGTDGKYNFSNLTPGTGYQVQFVTPSGFTQSSPVDVGGNDSIDSDGTFTGVVTLAPGENNPTVDSGFYNLASVGDYVFADNNANGIQDTGDTPLNGVKVELIKNNAVVATVLSNPDGSYLFNGLVPGDYQVKFTAPTGYIFTAADAGNDTVDSDANPTTGLTQTVTLTSGQLNGTLDAGLVPLASLGNFVFEDKNANGIQDAGEAGIAGATVNLIKNGNVIATTTTGTDGKYNFSNLTPGTGYQVQFVTPSGFTQSSPVDVGGNDSIDSDGTFTGVVTLAPGENNPTVDSGFYNLASVGDYVFADNNANGIQDTGDTPLNGVKVELIKNNAVVATVLSNPDGSYLFNGLVPGDYQVKFTAPTGYIFTTADAGNDTVDSDANPTTGLTQTVTLTSGQLNGTLDAGLVPLASLGNFVFEDKNANGIQDAGEAGIAGATVNLIKNGNVIATTTTGTDGKYNFSNLTPGTGYQVQFVTPSGFTQSSPVDVGGNDSIDSDGTFTGVVTLAPGENNPTVDSGFYNLASVGDYVFADNNANGIQDTGDTPLNGVKVELIKNNAVVATVLSNPDGSYLFNGLVPGDYQVKFTAPTGYIFTAADAGNDTVDSDANPTTGLTQTVTLTSGQLNGTLDAGLVPLASLGNFVFEDKNANGIQDAGEAGIAGATVNLIKNGNVIATTTTGTDGKYNFSNLTPGTGYQVQFVTPSGFTQSSPVDVGGNDSIDSDGTFTGVVTLAPGENNPTVDSGFYNLASVGDYVFADNNANGIQDTGDTPLNGVKVELIKNNAVVATVLSNPDGSYLFNGLVPGDYQVKFTAPTGYIFTAADAGNDTVDSDANPTTGLTQTVTLTSGQLNGTLDAGLVPLASLGNFVFEDKNANGIQDAGEAGIAGATVNLIKNGNVIATTTTGTDGKYNFSNLTPGTGYQVQFVTPSGFTQSSPVDVGGNDSIDSDGTFTGVVTLAPGENNPTVDSGFYNLASVGDYVFADNNANGIQDTGDTPLNGVKVELIKNNAVVATVLSNPDGSYLFNGLVPGDYQVKFTAPTGYIFTAADAGNDTVDSDANPTTGLTQTVTLTSGQLNGTLDAGLVPLASLGNFVFEDKNANGIQDAGEAGIAGASVNLLDAAGNFIKTTTTNGSGLYSFTNLRPGDYKVQFVQPTGFNGVSPLNVGMNDAVDSDGLVSDVVNLSPGENDTSVDSGFYKTASLGDKVWLDSNLNGIQDTGEAGVSGVTVTLTGGGADRIINGVSDTTVTTTTNTSGNYNFTNLTPGEQYQVTFGRPAGYNFTQKDVNSNSQDTVDSDADLVSGKSQIVTLSSGENNLTIDAGIYQAASDLSITKTDGLTTVSPGQQITYTIVAQNNGLVTATNALVNDIMPTNLTNVTWTSVASSGATGNDLTGTGSINDYVTLATGSSITYKVTGTVATNALTQIDNTPTTISLTSNTNSPLNGTAGNIRNFSANGISVNASAFSSTSTGTWNTAYLGLYGSYGLGVTDGSEDGNNGTHHIDNSGRNNYVLMEFSDSVVIDKAALSYVVGDSDISVWIGNFNNPYTNHLTLNSSVLSSFGFTEVNNGGSTDRTADINASNIVGNAVIIAAKVGESDDEFKLKSLDIFKATTQTSASLVNTATITAPTGFTDTNLSNNSATDTDIIGVPTVKIGDRVWYDTNGNGVQDTGEAGVSGVTVKLLNQGGTQISTTTTDSNGLYQFTANANSTYSVEFVQPTTGFNGFTTANVSNNTLDTTDSDVDVTTGKTATFTVGTTDNLTIDAGLIKNIVDLSITKTDGLTTVSPGQQITYTIVAANNGPMTATNALVSDVMPTNLTNVTWTSVASTGATGNDLTGTGSINDTVTLANGSSITYTVKGTVAAPTTTLGSEAVFDFSGNSGTSGSYGNSRTFSANGINVTASAFSRVDGTNGAWATAYLGSYGGGLGVTDSSEGNGSGNSHTVDNTGGRDNYVLFQFSESVVLDRAYLGYVVGDSDLSVWIGNFNSPITTLNDSVLSSFGFTEINNTTSSSARWADVNAGNYAGNTIVIAASTADTNDYFKIENLDVNKVVQSTSSLTNTATITAPTGFTDTNLTNNSATDTDTISNKGSIGDRVWLDADLDGIQDNGESGVSGVTVKLFNSTNNALLGTQATDTNGNYLFQNLDAGNYYVQVTKPSDYSGFTSQNKGSNDAVDSDVDSLGKTGVITLSQGENDLTNDAGLIKYNTGGNGCGKNYWNSHTSLWTGCNTNQSYESVFNTDYNKDGIIGNGKTCYEALNSSDSFLRETVGAYLNSCSLGSSYKYTKEQVIGLTQQACAGTYDLSNVADDKAQVQQLFAAQCFQ